MRYLERIVILLLLLFMISCGTNSESENLVGEWMDLGIVSENVTALEFNNGTIFLASKTEVYKKNVNSPSSEWVDISLQFNAENSVLGDILLTDEGLYAVVRNTTEFYDLPDNYTSLYKSIDMGENWDSVQINLEGREKPYVINRLAKTESSLYADWHIIFKSVDGGETWKNLIPSNNVGVSEFLYVSKDHPNQIWTGGWNNIFSPYLAKSEDGGESWKLLNENIYLNADANAYAVVVHPKKEHMVLSGFGGSVASANVIRKSTDGGEAWETKLEGFNIRLLVNSQLQENRVYASGIKQNGTLFFTASSNFGDTWQTVEFETGPTEIHVNDMISVLQNGKEVLYFGTNKGVYSYTFAK